MEENLFLILITFLGNFLLKNGNLDKFVDNFFDNVPLEMKYPLASDVEVTFDLWC